MKKATVRIGTSGWHYGHWKGPFYPEDARDSELLEIYARHFSTAEINNSFYQLPTEKAIRGWKDSTPRNFVFSMKASRFITHNKNLKDPETTLPKFFDRMSTLGDKAGPVLFQLPPRWKLNLERLKSFVAALPKGYRYAFEFRNHTWHTDEVYDVLSEAGVAFCIYDLDGFLSPEVLSTDFAYVRLHGPDGPYRGSYGKKALEKWAGKFSSWKVKEVYCYFDNDQDGYAALNAESLLNMLET